MISIRYKSFSEEQKKIVYRKTDGICIICGKKVSNDPKKWSIEHYIPRAVYKWVPNQKLKNTLESESNLFIVHKKCNAKKDAELPTINAIRNLPVNDILKADIIKLYKDIHDSLLTYRTIKQRVLARQKNQCFFCKKIISLFDATLRRQNNNKSRTANNAMCLCSFCSMRAGNPRYKAIMVKKIIDSQS